MMKTRKRALLAAAALALFIGWLVFPALSKHVDYRIVGRGSSSPSSRREMSIVAKTRLSNVIHVRDLDTGADVVAGEFSRRWVTKVCWGDNDREIWFSNGDVGFVWLQEDANGSWSTPPYSGSPPAANACLG
jgi:hypothetical protein